MSLKHLLIGTLSLAALSLASPALSQSALSGKVASQKEGAMEGVVVSARREGSTITVSVVTDAQGRYAFPAGRLEPGKYTLRARATGYDLDGRDRKSTRLNSSHIPLSRMPSSA